MTEHLHIPGPKPRVMATSLARGVFATRGAAIVPGLILVGGIALLASELRRLPGLAIFSPMILATLLGMVFHNVLGTPAWAKLGVTFSLRRILRLGIILLGLQLTASQVAQIGATGLLIILATVAATFMFTKCFAVLIGVERKMAELIAAGTSICGASAIIATNTVTRGNDEDVAYAVACVTVLGSLSMFLYPLVPALLQLNAQAFGLWSGASIHEIAQVVAAAFQNGAASGEIGTVAKMTRVMMLAPIVLSLGVIAARRTAAAGDAAAVPMPWFVFGFIALIAVNSLLPLTPSARAWLGPLTTTLLSMALAAMGLETDFRKLKAEGLKPFALAAASWIFIAGFSLVLLKLTSYS